MCHFSFDRKVCKLLYVTSQIQQFNTKVPAWLPPTVLLTSTRVRYSMKRNLREEGIRFCVHLEVCTSSLFHDGYLYKR